MEGNKGKRFSSSELRRMPLGAQPQHEKWGEKGPVEAFTDWMTDSSVHIVSLAEFKQSGTNKPEPKLTKEGDPVGQEIWKVRGADPQEAVQKAIEREGTKINPEKLKRQSQKKQG